MSGKPVYLMGLPVYTSAQLVKDEEYDVTERLTLWQRWIEPLINWQTQPFEPWVKTRRVRKVRQAPSYEVIQTPQGYYMHPEALRKLQEQMLHGR